MAGQSSPPQLPKTHSSHSWLPRTLPNTTNYWWIKATAHTHNRMTATPQSSLATFTRPSTIKMLTNTSIKLQEMTWMTECKWWAITEHMKQLKVLRWCLATKPKIYWDQQMFSPTGIQWDKLGILRRWEAWTPTTWNSSLTHSSISIKPLRVISSAVLWLSSSSALSQVDRVTIKALKPHQLSQSLPITMGLLIQILQTTHRLEV